MLNDNFRTIMTSVIMQSNSPAGKVVLLDGTKVSSHSSASVVFGTSLVVVYTASPTREALVVGSGTTPATMEDYKLENPITSGLATYSVSRNVTFAKEYSEAVWTLTLSNTSSAPITVSEIGYVTAFTSGSASTTQYALTDRTVLDTPITIPAGESRTLTYSIRLNLPA